MAVQQATEWIEASSPNFGPRRSRLRPELVVLHYTAMATAEAALARLCDPAAQVSCHWLIAEDGRLWRLVPEEARAWHAGAGSWQGRDDVNSRSIGIELANAGPLAGLPPYPEPQVATLERLLDGIRARWSIDAAGVIGHSDMAPGRKSDPGPKFDWRRLARGGRAIWPGAGNVEEAAADWDSFRRLARTAGYPEGDDGDLLASVRLRLRPGISGALPTEADLAVLRAFAVELSAATSPRTDRDDG